jgi:hypothetical protein
MQKIRVSVYALLATAVAASAQQPTLLRVGYTKLNPGATPEYEEVSKLVSAAYKKAGVPWRQVWATGIAGEMMYVSVSPVQSLSQFDGPSPITTQLSPEERVRYSHLLRSAVRESHFVLAQIVPELSIMSEREDPFALARVTNIVVRPGKYQDFEETVKTILIPAWQKAGIKAVHTLRNVTGGAMGGYTLVTFADKYAEIDSWGTIDKLLGPEIYHRFMETIGTTVDHADNLFARQLKDLGFVGETAAARKAKSSTEEVAEGAAVVEGQRVSGDLRPVD